MAPVVPGSVSTRPVKGVSVTEATPLAGSAGRVAVTVMLLPAARWYQLVSVLIAGL